jgi:sugar O-acyltransferase (sialic acid O-acetyltransferase NeuD family)
MKKILFIGAGGHFKDVFNWYLDQTKQQGLKNEIKGIIDDEKIHLEYEPVTKLKIYKFEEVDITNELYFILAIGQISIRKKIISKYQNLNFETCIHPNASISTNCVYKKGNLFGPNVVIAGDCKLGNFNNFSQNSTASHDCIIGDNNFFSPSSSIMGNCQIGENNFFGVSSNMIPGVNIKDNNIIGANSTIVKSVKSNNNTFIGVPAKVKK